MGKRSDQAHTDARYWADYDGLQAIKHRILGRYLDAWFPILSSLGGQLLYLDCHAGRGRHDTGDPGSPIIVLEHLRDHRLREQILRRVEVFCHFFEVDQSNADRFEREIDRLGALPDRVHVHVHAADYEESVSHVLEHLESTGAELPPSFAFIDPYGFKLSMGFLNRVLNAGRTETLINFMYRYVDMAVARQPMEPILDELFGTPDWRRLRSIEDKDTRFTATVKLFSDQLAAERVSWIVMRSDSGEVKYVLFHATNSLDGRRVMKDAIYAALPDGSFTAYERDRPEQGVLITAKRTPFRELCRMLEEHCGGTAVRLVEDLYPLVDASPYRRPHLHAFLRREIRRSTVRNVDAPGKFVISHNPLLQIPVSFPEASAAEDGDDQVDLFRQR